MDKKTQGIVIGIAAALLWFAPFVDLGDGYYQAGQHIGGISYALLFACGTYAILGWLEKHELALIAAIVGLGICLLFAVQAGTSIKWGLIVLIAVLGYGAYFSRANKAKTGSGSDNEEP